MQRLNEIPGIEIDAVVIPGKPVIELATLAEHDALQAFLAALDWWFAELKASQNGMK